MLLAAAASMLCATLAMLHARADAGPDLQSKQRRPDHHASLAQAQEHAQLSAADLRQVAAPSYEPASSRVASAPPTDAEPARDEAASQSGVRRIAKRHTRAAHSGTSQASQAAHTRDNKLHSSGGKLEQPMRLW